MAEIPEVDKFDSLVAQYRNLFNDGPPTVGLPYQDAIEMMEKAIKEGKPHNIADENLPEGAIV
jgi:hypothetical protein